MNAFYQYLRAPVNNAPLVVWRFAFGLLMLLESWGAIATGWVKSNLVDPSFTFTFFGFEWLNVLLGWPMYGYFALMGLAALGVALGYRYRWSALLLAVLWTGAYLMQKSSYNNHYYLAVLLCWWMLLLPAQARASLDVRRETLKRMGQNLCARWIYVFAKAQLFIVFTYGAFAKLYPGWLEGDFIATIFRGKATYWLIGPLLQASWFQGFITYGAIAFDAVVIPLLWWRPTRKLAFLGLIGFNLFNSVVFQIGIFPYLVLAMTVFFFDADRVEAWFKLKRLASVDQVKPLFGRWAYAAFLVYFIIQLALPLRHHFIPGDVNWTEEGHRMSWRMMLRTKSGTIALEANNPSTGETQRIRPRDYLTAKQTRHLAVKPDFLYRFVQVVKDSLHAQGWEDVALYAKRNRVYLNGRGPETLFAPDVDLAKVTWNTFGHNAWVNCVKLEAGE